eukprot:Nk52_evm16s271 gene=Nk52_evmTU16s271
MTISSNLLRVILFMLACVVICTSAAPGAPPVDRVEDLALHLRTTRPGNGLELLYLKDLVNDEDVKLFSVQDVWEHKVNTTHFTPNGMRAHTVINRQDDDPCLEVKWEFGDIDPKQWGAGLCKSGVDTLELINQICHSTKVGESKAALCKEHIHYSVRCSTSQNGIQTASLVFTSEVDVINKKYKKYKASYTSYSYSFLN